MREIKFRGKRVNNGEWAYGAFVPDATERTHGDMVTWGFIRRHNIESGRMESIEVDRKSVGQYTGLKDKNGTEIYEGDIVTWDDRSNGKYWRVAQVYYDKFGRLCYKFTHKTTTTDLIGSIWYQGQFAYAETTHIDLEIIGNIHENPELLGGSECEVFKGLNK